MGGRRNLGCEGGYQTEFWFFLRAQVQSGDNFVAAAWVHSTLNNEHDSFLVTLFRLVGPGGGEGWDLFAVSRGAVQSSVGPFARLNPKPPTPNPKP